MVTLQPTLRLGRDVWNRAAMPIEEFHRRADRLRAEMHRSGLDALLLYGRGLNECGHPTYLSNYVVKLPFSALVVLPREGDPALIFEGATRGRAAAQATTWIEDVQPCWDVPGRCLAALRGRGLGSSAIGLAGLPRLMPCADWTALAAGLEGATLVDAENLVWQQRAIKSVREIAQVRRASQIVHEALASVRTAVMEIAGEARLADFVMREARMRGAEDIRFLIARPEQSIFRPAEAAPIAEGDTIAVYLSVSWERYWSEAIRSFVCRGGRLDTVAGDQLAERFRSIVGEARAGVRVADWFRTARAAMPAAGIQALESIGLGHGIGVTPEEMPLLTAESQSTIQAGMCLVIRTASSGDRGLHLYGDTVVV